MQKTFDFIIVGAGSAGCVLAERLSRDPGVRVLVLEAGGWDKDMLIRLPMACREMTIRGMYRWADMSEPDPLLQRRSHEIPHGKVIGGGSSINYMAHTRCHPGNYDDWARAGATGWSHADMLPFLKAGEAWEFGEDAFRGAAGPIGALRSHNDDPAFDAWFGALRTNGYVVTDDHNGAVPNGFGMLQYSIMGGRRASAARGFLHPALRRANLQVQVNALATRVLFEGRKAVGVEYVADGRRETASAARTILSLGAINTPQLLMLSGVGPAAHLQSMGIRPLADLPVGQGLEDHLAVELCWERREPGTFHRFMRMDRTAGNMLRSLLLRSGPAARLPGAILGFWNTRDANLRPNLQYYLQTPPGYANPWFPGLKAPYQDALCARAILVGQESRGEILLRSTDPADRPRIFYKSLSAPRDIETLREGIRRICQVAQSPELSAFRGKPLFPVHALNTDAQIDDLIRGHAIQQYHPASTCKMGTGDDAVVDPRLNVHGLDGLSVMDASVMPHLITGNPNFPIMAMAGKASTFWTGADAPSPAAA